MILLTYLEDPLFLKLIIIIIKILKLITIIIKVFQVVISTLILISENNNNSKDPILTLLNLNKNSMFPLKISLKMTLLKNYKNNLMMEVYLP